MIGYLHLTRISTAVSRRSPHRFVAIGTLRPHVAPDARRISGEDDAFSQQSLINVVPTENSTEGFIPADSEQSVNNFLPNTR